MNSFRMVSSENSERSPVKIANRIHWGFWTYRIQNRFQCGFQTESSEESSNAAEQNSVSFANGTQWLFRMESFESVIYWNPVRLSSARFQSGFRTESIEAFHKESSKNSKWNPVRTTNRTQCDFSMESTEISERNPVRLLNVSHWRFWTESSEDFDRNSERIQTSFQWGFQTESSEDSGRNPKCYRAVDSSEDSERESMRLPNDFRPESSKVREQKSVIFLNGTQWRFQTEFSEARNRNKICLQKI